MTAATATFGHARRRGSALRLVPLWGAMFVLWAYIGSVYVYKTWYIAMALVGTGVVMLAAANAIDLRGLVSAALLPFFYFTVLLAGMLWAQFPRETLRWVAIDSITFFVFVLFYIVYRNAPPRAIAAGLTTLIVPAVGMSVLMYRIDPTLTRLGHYALPLLPVVIPFAWAQMTWSKRRWVGALTIAVAFGVLLAARSRAPLAAGGVAAVLSMFAFRTRSLLSLVRRAAVAALAVIAVAGVLLAVKTTRQLVLVTYVRFTHMTVHWGDIYLEAEGVDTTRVAINELAKKLSAEHFPRGIGYLNFNPNFEREHGYVMSLHSMYATWWVEGGLLCVLVVAAMFWRHFGALRRALRLPGLEERYFARACLVATIAVMLMGLFHQMHQGPSLWLLLGLGAGMRRRTPSA
jgi:O-antigen ligase